MKKFLIIFFFIFLSSPVIAGELFVTKSGHLAAIHEEDYDRAQELASFGDKVAFTRFVENNNNVFILREGIEVYRETIRIRGHKVKIRPIGETVSFWTSYHAIESKKSQLRTTPSQSRTPTAPAKWFTKGTYIGAKYEADLDKAIQLTEYELNLFILENDYVIILPSNLEVEIIIRKNRENKVKISPVGESTTLWTTLDGIEHR